MLTPFENQPSSLTSTVEFIPSPTEAPPPQIKPFVQVPALSSFDLVSPTWLWPDYIPCGSLTLLDGPTGSGKTQFLVDLAARVSSGRPMPDDSTGLHGSVTFTRHSPSLMLIATASSPSPSFPTCHPQFGTPRHPSHPCQIPAIPSASMIMDSWPSTT
jgi:hypothetical protein